MALHNTTTKQEFKDKVIDNKKVVLVDFWAAWCAPCRAMAPHLEAAAKSQDEIADIVKVNIEESDDNNALAAEHEVRSIPNMVVFKDGQEVSRIIGLVGKADVEAELKKFS